MSRLLRRQRVVLALFITFSVGFVGAALAAPQTGDNPSVTLDVIPNDGNGLTNGEAITVLGTGFQTNGFGVTGVPDRVGHPPQWDDGRVVPDRHLRQQ